MSIEPAQSAWELAEDLAIEKFYIKHDEQIAEKPAFLLFNDFFCKGWQLSFGQMQIYRFKSKAESYRKLNEFARKSKTPIEILLKLGKKWKVIAKSETTK